MYRKIYLKNSHVEQNISLILLIRNKKDYTDIQPEVKG